MGPVRAASDGAEVLDGSAAGRWERWWLSLPVRRRRRTTVLAAGLVVVLLAVAGAVQVTAWLDEREDRRAVSLAASLGVWTSSSSPPGGYVTYYLEIRNSGASPLEVVSVTASDERLRLRSSGDGVRQLGAGHEIQVPVSALLTCSSGSVEPDLGLQIQVDVRSGDGRVTRQHPVLPDAGLLLDPAETLCQVRPTLVDYELSGPVLRSRSTDGSED